MTLPIPVSGIVQARSAIEALRAGVPNGAAIRLLGTSETTLEGMILDYLRRIGSAVQDESQPHGIVIAGAFGAGKSHTLGYIAELAKERNFIVSLVPISKETSLFDPARLFAAAIRAAEVPKANDVLLTAIMSRLQPNGEAYARLEQWTTAEVQAGRLSTLFAALVHAMPRTTPEDQGRIARFFGGGKLNLFMVKGWLRDAGAAKLFELKPAREADLALQRLRFLPQLFIAAGYAGWCILMDEVELIGRYGPLQRGRSYAELARWFALDADDAIPGIAAVAAITNDFTDVMFNRRLDDELIPARLEAKGLARQAVLARTGIDWLERRQVALRPPDLDSLLRCLQKIASLYQTAYGWTPQGYAPGPVAASRSMRQYIKSTITTWDVDRLYRETAAIRSQTMLADYSENLDMEHAPPAEDEDDSDG